MINEREEFIMKNGLDEKIDHKKINELIRLGSSILKVLLVVISVVGLYSITLIFKEWKLMNFILTILQVLSPVFVGLIIAWLLDPIVRKLMKNGISRVWAALLVYLVMLTIIYLLFVTIFPMLIKQINEFLLVLPNIVKDVSAWVDGLLGRFKGLSIIDMDTVKKDITNYINSISMNFTSNTPEMMINFVRNIFGAVGELFISLMLGLYILFDFNNMDKVFLSLLPRRIRTDTKNLFVEANHYLFSYVKGTMLVSLLIFSLNSIAFVIVGLKSPLLFGLICGITNIIPYLGPYLGGIPAVIVGFTQGIPTGLLTLLVIVISQTIEGNFIQPMVMSKSMKLHPVTIVVGLLIMGYFFGIVGMIVSTPVIAILKSLLVFFDKKYTIIKGREERDI